MDDIQVLLDEHTQKVQTMRGSPYVKPFEAEIRTWEEKLLSMQDILDAWIKVGTGDAMVASPPSVFPYRSLLI